MLRYSSLFVFILISITNLVVRASPLVPCFFIFGDSLSDPGNNNPLKTKAKANYHPYGIDFPTGKPTGRFTNGQTAIDVIGQKLGFHRHIPPFSATKGHDIRNGVNYASGAAGIRPETGRHLGEIVTLDMQLRHHKRIISKLNAMENGSAHGYLKQCLYTINIGSNDYINNYYGPAGQYKTSRKYTIDTYAASLTRSYQQALRMLYENGARKVAVFGLGLIGCSPGSVTRHRPTTPCVDKMNTAVSVFNAKLRTLLAELNHKHHDANFTYINLQGMAGHPKDGIKVINRPCCKSLRDDFQCKDSSTICKHRNAYYFWDGYHPTANAHSILGSRAFKKTSHHEAIPFDIQTLVKFRL